MLLRFTPPSPLGMISSTSSGKLKNFPRVLVLSLSLEERAVVRHSDSHHSHTKEGRFVVPLSKRQDAKFKAIGESQSQAVRRFMSLKRSLNLNGHFESVMQEYNYGLRPCGSSPTWGYRQATARGILLTDACSVQEFQYYHRGTSCL